MSWLMAPLGCHPYGVTHSIIYQNAINSGKVESCGVSEYNPTLTFIVNVGSVNSLVPGKAGWDFRTAVFNLIFHIGIFKSFFILSSVECHGTIQMVSQHWFRQRLGAVRQQAITWANVDQDICRLMASLGHNNETYQKISCWFIRIPM